VVIDESEEPVAFLHVQKVIECVDIQLIGFPHLAAAWRAACALAGGGGRRILRPRV